MFSTPSDDAHQIQIRCCYASKQVAAANKGLCLKSASFPFLQHALFWPPLSSCTHALKRCKYTLFLPQSHYQPLVEHLPARIVVV